jgi:ADP-ribose pyrophosphatase YjhB (NUDIX family)
MNRGSVSYPALAKRRLACENERFSVFLDELTCEGRPYATDYLVVAPKQVAANLVTGVAVLPICEGRIGLIRVYRHAIQNDSWEIPRGFVEEGEGVLSSALRELEEETGLYCEPSEIRSLGFVTPDAAVLAARVHVHVALRCVRVRSYTAVELGHREFCLFDDAEVKDMISRSEIQDPCTLIAFYRHNNLKPQLKLGAL